MGEGVLGDFLVELVDFVDEGDLEGLGVGEAVDLENGGLVPQLDVRGERGVCLLLLLP